MLSSNRAAKLSSPAGAWETEDIVECYRVTHFMGAVETFDLTPHQSVELQYLIAEGLYYVLTMTAAAPSGTRCARTLAPPAHYLLDRLVDGEVGGIEHQGIVGGGQGRVRPLRIARIARFQITQKG